MLCSCILCDIFYCILFYYTPLVHVMSCYMILYIYIWYDMIWYDMIWYDMIWYDQWYDMICWDCICLIRWLVLFIILRVWRMTNLDSNCQALDEGDSRLPLQDKAIFSALPGTWSVGKRLLMICNYTSSPWGLILEPCEHVWQLRGLCRSSVNTIVARFYRHRQKNSISVLLPEMGPKKCPTFDIIKLCFYVFISQTFCAVEKTDQKPRSGMAAADVLTMDEVPRKSLTAPKKRTHHSQVCQALSLPKARHSNNIFQYTVISNINVIQIWPNWSKSDTHGLKRENWRTTWVKSSARHSVNRTKTPTNPFSRLA